MKELVETLIKLVPFLQAYPIWVRGLVGAWILLTATILIIVVVVPKQSKTTDPALQKPYAYIKGTVMEPLVAGKNPGMLFQLQNGPANSSVVFSDVTCIFAPVALKKKHFDYIKGPTQTVNLAPGQEVTGRWTCPFVPAQFEIDALNSSPPAAELYVFVRGKRIDETGEYDFNQHWKYAKDFPTKAVLCGDDIKVEDSDSPALSSASAAKPTPAQNSDNTERAYVYFRHAVLKAPLAAGTPPVVEIIIENTGKREAIVTSPGCAWYRTSDPKDRALKFPQGVSPPPAAAPLSIVPGGHYRGELQMQTCTLTDEQIKDLNEEKAWLFFFSPGEYKDENGKTYPLDFCRQYDKTVPGQLVVCPADVTIIK